VVPADQTMATAGSTSTETGQTANLKEPEKKFTGICASCQWFKEAPFKRKLYGVMILWCLSNAVYIVIRAGSEIAGDVLIMIASIAMAAMCANHFKTLLGLKEQLNKFAKQNAEMKAENGLLSSTVSKLGKKQEELVAVNADLMETSQQYKANIRKFQEIDEKLKTLGDDNIAGLENLREMSKNVMGSLKKELIQHQRDILRTTHEAFEFGDDNEGMNKEEYERFLKALPPDFRERFESMGRTFEDIAGEDGVIDLDEFTALADQFSVTDMLMNAEHGTGAKQ